MNFKRENKKAGQEITPNRLPSIRFATQGAMLRMLHFRLFFLLVEVLFFVHNFGLHPDWIFVDMLENL